MPAKLIAKDDANLFFLLEKKEEWVIGSDENCEIVLPDRFCPPRCAKLKKKAEGFVLSPFGDDVSVRIDDQPLVGEQLIEPGAALTFGTITFSLTMDNSNSSAALLENSQSDRDFDFEDAFSGTATKDEKSKRWLLKILAGPNSGAQMNLEEEKSYLVGSESSCDIVLTDLSVSKQHLKVELTKEGAVSLTDLNSRNGVLVNGEKIETCTAQTANVLVTLGSTTLMLVDRQAPHKKTITPPIPIRDRALAPAQPEGDTQKPESASAFTEKSGTETPKTSVLQSPLHPKNRFILAAGTVISLLLIVMLFTLFHDKAAPLQRRGWENQTLADLLEAYPFTCTFNESDESVILQGHASSLAQREEIIAKLETLPFVERIDTRALVIDDSLCREFNQVLNKTWPEITLASPQPGVFVLNGMFSTKQQMDKLSQYLTLNFPYNDRLKSQILVVDTATDQINRRLAEIAPGEMVAQFSVQDLVIVGTVPMDKQEVFENYLKELNTFPGIANIQNLTTLRSLGQDDENAVDLSAKYKVTGSTVRSDVNVTVAINGKILQRGDLLDGMTVVSIQPDRVILQRETVRYKINYKV